MEHRDSPQPLLPAATPVPNLGLILDLGRQPRAHIKRLKQADGQLTAQIQAAVEEARKELDIAADKEIVPVVLLYSIDNDYVVLSRQA